MKIYQTKKKFLKLEKAGLNILMSLKGDKKPVAFIEDCAVTLDHLADYTSRLKDVFAKYNTELGCFMLMLQLWHFTCKACVT